ncbi:hypothetical protein A9Q99_08635 [Gammaproteobacteria bacterium 45_16_T64]|nr:hypothetical protein A9Q99_08635 [Gammaproteobacteria bacterium 45_16_T64]
MSTVNVVRDERFGYFNLFIFCLIFVPLSTFILGNKFDSRINTDHLSSLGVFDLYRLELGFVTFLLTWVLILLLKTEGKNYRFRVFAIIFVAPLFLLSAQGARGAAEFGKTFAFDSLQYIFSSLKSPFANDVTALLAFLVLPVVLFTVSFIYKARIIDSSDQVKNKGVLKALFTVLAVSFFLAFVPPFDKGNKASASYDALAYLWYTGVFPREDVAIINDDHWPAVLPVEKAMVKDPRNVVVIVLESVRYLSTSLHPQRDANTTPYLAALAESSYVAENAITTVPHTSKSTVAINCGIEPYLGRTIFESTLGVPVPCLPEILGAKGYNSVLFESSTETFENRTALVNEIGFKEYYPMERLPKGDFEMVNYFGYEDNIMLPPSKEWIAKQEKPFYALYFTGMTHHGYEPPTDYNKEHYSEDIALNDYLNSIRYGDDFIEAIFEQYREAGLYDDTIFVITADHGQGFGEHNQWFHNNIVYREGIHVPLIIHSRESRDKPKRMTNAVSQVDIVPSILSLLDVEQDYQGTGESVFSDHSGVVFTACWHELDCLARTDSKYSYHFYFSNRAEAIYDFEADPLEKNNIALKHPELLERFRAETIQWYSSIKSKYHNTFSGINANYETTISETVTYGSLDVSMAYRDKKLKQKEDLRLALERAKSSDGQDVALIGGEQ